VATLLGRLEELLQQNDRDTFSIAAIDGGHHRRRRDPGDRRSVFIRDDPRDDPRTRPPAARGIAPRDGYRVIVEILTETAARARVMTARFESAATASGDGNSWRIVAIERLTYVQGLYRCGSTRRRSTSRASSRSRRRTCSSRCTRDPSSRSSVGGGHGAGADRTRRDAFLAGPRHGKGTAANLRRQRDPHRFVGAAFVRCILPTTRRASEVSG
jgi:hypothetical protein